jgi:hypothetical protein
LGRSYCCVCATFFPVSWPSLYRVKVDYSTGGWVEYSHLLFLFLLHSLTPSVIRVHPHLRSNPKDRNQPDPDPDPLTLVFCIVLYTVLIRFCQCPHIYGPIWRANEYIFILMLHAQFSLLFQLFKPPPRSISGEINGEARSLYCTWRSMCRLFSFLCAVSFLIYYRMLKHARVYAYMCAVKKTR